MNPDESLIAVPVRNAATAARRVNQARALVFETVQTLTETTREALFAYAMTGSAVASLAIIAAPYLEVLLRCVFHGRG